MALFAPVAPVMAQSPISVIETFVECDNDPGIIAGHRSKNK